MTTLINFRDFGGKRTATGQYVRRDRLYRSGHLGWLDRADTDAMLALAFDLVIDLRYLDERKEHVSPWPLDWNDRVISHPNATDRDAPHLQILRTASSDIDQIDAAYDAFYAALPFDPDYRPLFAQAFTSIAQTRGRTLLHCSAGKDRTGVLAALLLSVLGVEDGTIVDDYLRSNEGFGMDRLREHVQARYADRGGHWDEERLNALIAVKPAYIAAALGAVRDKCGSVEAYLRQAGVDDTTLEHLRRACLTDSLEN